MKQNTIVVHFVAAFALGHFSFFCLFDFFSFDHQTSYSLAKVYQS